LGRSLQVVGGGEVYRASEGGKGKDTRLTETRTHSEAGRGRWDGCSLYKVTRKPPGPKVRSKVAKKSKNEKKSEVKRRISTLAMGNLTGGKLGEDMKGGEGRTHSKNGELWVPRNHCENHLVRTNPNGRADGN